MHQYFACFPRGAKKIMLKEYNKYWLWENGFIRLSILDVISCMEIYFRYISVSLSISLLPTKLLKGQLLINGYLSSALKWKLNTDVLYSLKELMEQKSGNCLDGFLLEKISTQWDSEENELT